jgi:hypothetical protein
MPSTPGVVARCSSSQWASFAGVAAYRMSDETASTMTSPPSPAGWVRA